MQPADGYSHQAEDLEAERLEHAADLPVAAFVEYDLEQKFDGFVLLS